MEDKKATTVTDAVLSTFQKSRERAAEQAAAAQAGKGAPVTMRALKADADSGVIFGVGGAAGDVNKLDLDGEFVAKADLTKMAFDFCASETRSFKANHKADVKAALVASIVGAPIIKDEKAAGGTRILKADEKLTDEMEVVGINTEKGNETHWFVGVRSEDPDVIAAMKAGEVVGFSWGADVVKTEVA